MEEDDGFIFSLLFAVRGLSCFLVRHQVREEGRGTVGVALVRHEISTLDSTHTHTHMHTCDENRLPEHRRLIRVFLDSKGDTYYGRWRTHMVLTSFLCYFGHREGRMPRHELCVLQLERET